MIPVTSCRVSGNGRLPPSDVKYGQAWKAGIACAMPAGKTLSVRVAVPVAATALAELVVLVVAAAARIAVAMLVVVPVIVASAVVVGRVAPAPFGTRRIKVNLSPPVSCSAQA